MKLPCEPPQAVKIAVHGESEYGYATGGNIKTPGLPVKRHYQESDTCLEYPEKSTDDTGIVQEGW
jgi:hypothetical protein